jgi:hypothetical protein
VLPPSDIAFGLNATAAWALLAPGLPAAYAGDAVGVALAVVGAPVAVLNGTGATGDGLALITAALRAEVDVYNAAGTALVAPAVISLNVSVGFSATLGWAPQGGTPGPAVPTNFSAAFHNVTATAALVNSTVGPVPNVALLADIVAAAINAVLPLVNNLTAHGIAFGLPGIFALTDSAFLSTVNYLQASTDFTLGPF